ncbi:amino acid permease-domain-containing protein [Blastocladiella britannica]|nr:amino acid permease-domain-containing protein [Blastocladiella britannica]
MPALPTALPDAVSAYLDKRRLATPFAGSALIAGFIVGIVISGAFTGFQTGLLVGWPAMLIATALAAVMYTCLVSSVTEMCTALPFASGPAAFAQAALNSGAGALTGGVYAVAYTILSATVLVSICETLALAFPSSIPSGLYNFIWLCVVALTTLALHWDPRVFFTQSLLLAIYSCALLLVYLVLVLFMTPADTNAVLENGTRTASWYAPGSGSVSFSAPGLSMKDIVRAFPFCCWLFSGLEAFACTAEEAKQIFKSAPRATLHALLIILFVCVSVVATAPQMDVAAFARSGHPLLDRALNLICSTLASPPSICTLSSHTSSFRHAPSFFTSAVVIFAVFPPLALSLTTATYTSARHLYTLSRSGVLPIRLSRTGSRGAPLLATAVTLLIQILLALLIRTLSQIPAIFQSISIVPPSLKDSGTSQTSNYCQQSDEGVSQMILLLSAWISNTSYLLQFSCYILIYLRLPNLPRPFHSPLGLPGAIVGFLVALMFGVIAPLCVNPFFYGTLLAISVAVLFLATVYWFQVARARMAESPEKIFVRLQIQHLYGRRRVPLTPPTRDSNHGGSMGGAEAQHITTTVPLAHQQTQLTRLAETRQMSTLGQQVLDRSDTAGAPTLIPSPPPLSPPPPSPPPLPPPPVASLTAPVHSPPTGGGARHRGAQIFSYTHGSAATLPVSPEQSSIQHLSSPSSSPRPLLPSSHVHRTSVLTDAIAGDGAYHPHYHPWWSFARLARAFDPRPVPLPDDNSFRMYHLPSPAAAAAAAALAAADDDGEQLTSTGSADTVKVLNP